MSLFVTDGNWTWFNDPRAQYRDGDYYVGTISAAGKVRIHRRFAGSQVVLSTTLHTFGADDHNNPGILFNSSGKLFAGYSQHPGNAYPRVSTFVSGASAFGREGSPLTGTLSYCRTEQTGDSNNTLWWFNRVNSTAPAPHQYFVSTDGGATFGTGVTFFDESTGHGTDNQRPYFQIFKRSSTRIDFICTRSNPNEGISNVYHFYLTIAANGATFTLSKSDGTQIGNYNIDGTTVSGTALPLGKADVTQVYDGSSTGAWVWDLCEISGTLTAAIATYGAAGTGSATHNYHVLTLNDGTGAWTDYSVCDGGGTGADYLYLAEPHYSGGICLDPNNQLAVYVSRKYAAGDFRLEKWTTSSLGSAWSKAVDISGNTSSVNARPTWCRGAPSTQIFYWRGTYTTYSNYSTDIHSYPDLTVNTSYTPVAKPGSPVFQAGALAGCIGIWPITEGSGTTLTDVYTSPHNGTFVSTPTWGSGSYGPELSGFATTKYITIDPASQLLQTGTYPWWIAVLYKNTGTTDGVAVCQGRASTNTGFLGGCRVNAGNNLARIEHIATDDANHQVPADLSSSTCNDGNYHVSIGIQYSSTDGREYNDATEAYSLLTATLGALTNDRLTIGALRRNTVTLPFPGTIALVAIGVGDAPEPGELTDDWLSGAFSVITASGTSIPVLYHHRRQQGMS